MTILRELKGSFPSMVHDWESLRGHSHGHRLISKHSSKTALAPRSRAQGLHFWDFGNAYRHHQKNSQTTLTSISRSYKQMAHSSKWADCYRSLWFAEQSTASGLNSSHIVFSARLCDASFQLSHFKTDGGPQRRNGATERLDHRGTFTESKTRSCCRPLFAVSSFTNIFLDRGLETYTAMTFETEINCVLLLSIINEWFWALILSGWEASS